MADKRANRLAKGTLGVKTAEIQRRVSACIRAHPGLACDDPFGFSPRVTVRALRACSLLYRHYFRVRVHGWRHVPTGPMIVASNHGGQLPFDAAMILTGFWLDRLQPLLLRCMTDRWTAKIPYLSTLLARTGQVPGSPSVCKQLLHMGQSVLVFPEGMAGMCKLFSQRYRLQDFGHGFVRMAMQTGCPVLPLAVIGAEEQAPAVANLKPLARLFGLPYFPLVLPQLVPLPLPVRYTLHIGAPIHFGPPTPTPERAAVAEGVAHVKQHIQSLITSCGGLFPKLPMDPDVSRGRKM